MNLSNESREFLDNLRLYLISSGKNERETVEIIQELEDHLLEAERNGKNVRDITGQTPKTYMKQIEAELSFDLKAITTYFFVIVFGMFAFILLRDALEGDLSYSVFVLVGFVLIVLCSIFFLFVLFRYMAKNPISKWKEWMLLALVSLLPTLLFLIILFLDHHFKTPTIHFGTGGRILVIICSILVLLGISIWSRTWIVMVVAMAFIIPELLLRMTNFEESMKVMLSSFFTIVVVGVYLFLFNLREKKVVEK